jgi:hypothetical protein
MLTIITVLAEILAIIGYTLMIRHYIGPLLKKGSIKHNNIVDQPNTIILTLNIGNREITKKNLKNACVFGGIIAGFVGALIIFILYMTHHPYWIGYGNMNPAYVTPERIVLFFLLQMFVGVFLGWLCGHFTFTKANSSENWIKRYSHIFLILISAFVSIIFFRQLMVRNALREPNTFPYEIDDLRLLTDNSKCIDERFIKLYHLNTDTSLHSKFVRMGGGYLGEPDFEMLATGLAGSTAFLILIVNLAELFKIGVQSKRYILSTRRMILITAKAAFFGFIAWISVYGIYLFLTETCIIYKFGFIYARWVFSFDFPHPERFLFVFVLCGIYLISMLISIQIYSVPKENGDGNETITHT